jgi:hypothetical protein
MSDLLLTLKPHHGKKETNLLKQGVIMYAGTHLINQQRAVDLKYLF